MKQLEITTQFIKLVGPIKTKGMLTEVLGLLPMGVVGTTTFLDMSKETSKKMVLEPKRWSKGASSQTFEEAGLESCLSEGRSIVLSADIPRSGHGKT